MADLKAAFVKAGFRDARTYIQTGNVLFSSPEADPAKLEKKIERALAKSIEYRGKAFVLTAEQLKRIAAANPFKRYTKDPDHYPIITFLSSSPSPTAIKKLKTYERDDYRFHVKGKAAYVLWKRVSSNRRSVPLERALGVAGTFRTNGVVDALIRLSVVPLENPQGRG